MSSPWLEYYDVRVGIVELLLDTLALPTPNVAHLLLGYETTRPIKSTVLQGAHPPQRARPAPQGPAATSVDDNERRSGRGETASRGLAARPAHDRPPPAWRAADVLACGP